jgi:hypothetical protein
MPAPLAEWFGAAAFPELNVPQAEAPQLDAVQSRPAAAISLVTVALNVAGVPAVTVEGLAVNETEMVGTILIVTEPDLVGSAMEIASGVT